MRSLTPIVFLAAILTGCGQETTVVQEESGRAQPGVREGLRRDVELPAGAVLAIGSVDDVTVRHPTTNPNALVVTARGTAFAGWSKPQLEPMPDTTGDVRVMSFKFTGVSPKEPSGRDATQRVSAELSLDSLPPAVMTIRIVSATNEKTASIPNLP